MLAFAVSYQDFAVFTTYVRHGNASDSLQLMSVDLQRERQWKIQQALPAEKEKHTEPGRKAVGSANSEYIFVFYSWVRIAVGRSECV